LRFEIVNFCNPNPFPTILSNNTATINDRIKRKQMTGQLNQKTADPRATASIFLFFSPTRAFLKQISETILEHQIKTN
jgi:hypothetical protein